MYGGYNPYGHAARPQSHAPTARDKALLNLRQNCQQLDEIETNNIFCVVLPGGQHNLQIFLPLDWPTQRPPELRVIPAPPPGSNRLLDSNGFVTVNWTPTTSVPQVIKDVVASFQRSNPPSRHGSLYNTQPPQSNRFPVAAPPVAQPPPPQNHSKFPIDHLTEQQLNDLLNDEKKFTEFCLGLPQLQHSSGVLQEMKESNEVLAQKNLEKEALIEQTRADLFASHQELHQAKDNYEAVYKQVSEKVGDNDPHKLLEKLNEAVQEKEEETEQISNSFLDGEMEAKDFVRDYKKERINYHLRAAKCEKLGSRLLA